MTRSARRGPWLPEEDGALMQLVRSQGPNNWVRISQQIQHRSPKQCRERYHQNLKPSLKHDPITAHEGDLIEQMVSEMGKRWAEIARRLGNRSDNAVKNWWNGSMNRRRRNPTQVSSGFKQVGARLQPIPFTSSASTTYPHTRTAYEARNPPGTDCRWSHGVVSDPNLYRHLHLQMPSPVHTQGSATAGNSPAALLDNSNMMHSSLSTMSSQPVLSRSSTVDVRHELPPLRPVVYPVLQCEKRASAYDRPLISPALSEVSQDVSSRRPPSLISDYHSAFSTSPKTVSSPRSSVHAHVDILGQGWNQHPSPSQHTLHFPERTDARNSLTSDSHTQITVETTLHKSPRSLLDMNSPKDARMHVSSLLG